MPQDQPDARIVLFDGVCAFCNGSVRWLIERDPEAHLQFAPLQGECARELRSRHPQIPETLESLVYVERDADGERVWLRSAALFRMVRELRAPWRWLSWLRVLPRALSDAAYDAFARRRYRWFGELASCPIPGPAVRARFLS